jgi:hypothetical protein
VITGFFIFLVILAIFCKVRFHQVASEIYKLSAQNNVEIFDVNYESAAQMSSDINFLKKLWAGELITDVSHLAIKVELIKARDFFRYQLLLGLLAVALVVINNYVST